MGRFLEKLADAVRKVKTETQPEVATEETKVKKPRKKTRGTEPVPERLSKIPQVQKAWIKAPDSPGPQPTDGYSPGGAMLLDDKGRWFDVENTHSVTLAEYKWATGDPAVGVHWMRVRYGPSFEFIEDPSNFFNSGAQEYGMNEDVVLGPSSEISSEQWAAIEEAVMGLSRSDVTIEASDGKYNFTAKQFLESGEEFKEFVLNSNRRLDRRKLAERGVDSIFPDVTKQDFTESDGWLVSEASDLGWKDFPADFDLEGTMYYRGHHAFDQEGELQFVVYECETGGPRVKVFND